MKKYNKPEIEMTAFSVTDIIQSSGEIMEEGVMLKTDIAGRSAMSYGTEDVSVFD